MTPLKAIRAKCIDCSAGSSHEVTKCPMNDCTLYPYRKGHNPARKGQGNPNWKAHSKKKWPTHEEVGTQAAVKA